MDSVRKWLMRANALAVFTAGLIALGLQIAWLIWRETRPARVEISPSSVRPRSQTDESLGLLAFLDAVAEPRVSSGNPFLNPRPERPPIIRPSRPPPNSEPLPPRPPAPPPPPPPPKREMIRLTYRGLFQNSAAETSALIEDSKHRRRSFYHVGETLFGMRVQDIRMLELLLRPPEGEIVILKLGEPYEFEERPHGY